MSKDAYQSVFKLFGLKGKVKEKALLAVDAVVSNEETLRLVVEPDLEPATVYKVRNE